MKLNIGSTVYEFDEGRRIYPKNDIFGSNAPIYSEHFVGSEITSETSRSWINKYGDKIPKGDRSKSRFYTKEEMDDDIWMESNRHKIIEKLRLIDCDTLKKIAEIIGHQE